MATTKTIPDHLQPTKTIREPGDLPRASRISYIATVITFFGLAYFYIWAATVALRILTEPIGALIGTTPALWAVCIYSGLIGLFYFSLLMEVYSCDASEVFHAAFRSRLQHDLFWLVVVAAGFYGVGILDQDVSPADSLFTLSGLASAGGLFMTLVVFPQCEGPGLVDTGGGEIMPL